MVRAAGEEPLACSLQGKAQVLALVRPWPGGTAGPDSNEVGAGKRWGVEEGVIQPEGWKGIP